jgi:hypothetical protein
MQKTYDVNGWLDAEGSREDEIRPESPFSLCQPDSER